MWENYKTDLTTTPKKTRNRFL